jgi:hypothetical protein
MQCKFQVTARIEWQRRMLCCVGDAMRHEGKDRKVPFHPSARRGTEI